MTIMMMIRMMSLMTMTMMMMVVVTVVFPSSRENDVSGIDINMGCPKAFSIKVTLPSTRLFCDIYVYVMCNIVYEM